MTEKKFQKTVDQMSPDEYIAYEDFLAAYKGEDRVVSSLEIAEEMKNDTTPTYKVSSGIPSLDRMLDGFEAGELVVATGPTGHGKTALMLQITREMANTDAKPLWFSYEVSYRQLINKLGETGPIFEFFMPREIVSNHLDFIEKKIMESHIKHGTRVAFIDHLSMLYSLDKFAQRNVSLELGDVVAKIKAMALRHNVVIFLVSHVKKLEQGNEVFLEDIRDSGHIANLADTVITVQRVTNDYTEGDRKLKPIEEDDNRIKIKVEKNRRKGTRGSFLAEYNNGIITELPPSEYRKTEKALAAIRRVFPDDDE